MNFNVISPKHKKDLLTTIKKFQNKNFRFGAGFTDLLTELKNKGTDDLTIINLVQVKDSAFTSFKKMNNGLRMGAMVSAQDIISNETIKKKYSVLYEAATQLASTQIRQVATVGGNICTASPSGDLVCALVALEANCELLDKNGIKRIIPISDFLKGVRKTALRKNELLYTIHIPDNKKLCTKFISRFIKIGTRQSMECAVVSLAYHIQTDKKGIIIQAGIGIGASAPTIRFTGSACNFLLGKKFSSLNEYDRELFAKEILKYASPISDLRASSWYRKEVLYNISKSIY